MPRLEEWSIGIGMDNPYQAPELQKIRLFGEIFNDEKGRFPDGSSISTSSIKDLNIKEGYGVTRNTKYILGKPSDSYVKWLEDNGKKLEDYIK